MKTNVIFTLLMMMNLLSSYIYAENKENDILYNSLIKEIRCMVCQNQNIAESEAPLAVDLKNKVRDMINEGRDEEYIKNYMSSRYSDFILYDPPLRLQNYILWFGPFIFLGFITYILFRRKINK
ncbi:MAG: Cytochrome c-type biogenesis protein CcmH [Gammaproteobacteria bacterium]|nr:MAG: hypothetical protein CBE17_02410 [Gammaproteobacteria bacterium TMED257]CAI8334065.1 MAG: Cytochrome c-type biogenesis protein CcmH [Gammaproteobacteria bacterium]|tara:strand:- start:4997 stop:5368 length:372 start_codon:yes stop_codon:yes gene_type:complete